MVFAFIGIFLLWWILTALVYRHTHSNFLRAESGWFLFLSHSAPAVQHDAEKDLLTTSFNGHYAPLAFLAEFATAKLIGTHASFWKWRQITVLALLATILFLFARNSGSALQLSRLRASLCATGLTAILIFQAQMRDFIAWPFMILQLFWLLFTMISLLGLVQMARHPAKTLWPWVAAGAALCLTSFSRLGHGDRGSHSSRAGWHLVWDSAPSLLGCLQVNSATLEYDRPNGVPRSTHAQAFSVRSHDLVARLAAHPILDGVSWFHSKLCPCHAAWSLQHGPANTGRVAKHSILALRPGDPSGLWFSRYFRLFSLPERTDCA